MAIPQYESLVLEKLDTIQRQIIENKVMLTQIIEYIRYREGVGVELYLDKVKKRIESDSKIT